MNTINKEIIQAIEDYQLYTGKGDLELADKIGAAQSVIDSWKENSSTSIEPEVWSKLKPLIDTFRPEHLNEQWEKYEGGYFEHIKGPY